MPLVGFGTHKAKVRHLQEALAVGYRHIDAALEYGTQPIVGKAIQKSGVPRKDLFVTTKVGGQPSSFSCCGGLLSLKDPFHPMSGVSQSAFESNMKSRELDGIQLSLDQLNLTYVDLCLIHRPAATGLELYASYLPHAQLIGILGGLQRSLLQMVLNAAVSLEAAGDTDRAEGIRLESWRQLEEAKRRGLCRHLGVSNYPLGSLKALESAAREPVEVIQLEYSPTCQFRAIYNYAMEKDIALMGYGTTASRLSQARRMNDVAERHKRSLNQVMLRWRLQKGVGVLQYSRNVARMQENAEVIGFELHQAEMEAFDSLNAGDSAHGCRFYDVSWHDGRGSGRVMSTLRLLMATVGFILAIPFNGLITMMCYGCCLCCCCARRLTRRRGDGDGADGDKEL